MPLDIDLAQQRGFVTVMLKAKRSDGQKGKAMGLQMGYRWG